MDVGESIGIQVSILCQLHLLVQLVALAGTPDRDPGEHLSLSCPVSR